MTSKGHVLERPRTRTKRSMTDYFDDNAPLYYKTLEDAKTQASWFRKRGILTKTVVKPRGVGYTETDKKYRMYLLFIKKRN